MPFTIFAVIIVLILRSQPVPADVDVRRLRGGFWQTVAMAIGFAMSIPLYLIIGQRAFALWAVAPILSRLIYAQLRRRQARANHRAKRG